MVARNRKIAEHIVLHHDDVKAVNAEDAPDTVSPVKGEGGVIDGCRMSVALSGLSWNVVRLVKSFPYVCGFASWRSEPVFLINAVRSIRRLDTPIGFMDTLRRDLGRAKGALSDDSALKAA